MNLLLILEGNEEETLFEILRPLFSSKYNVILKNANSCSNVASYLHSNISNDYYDAIFCVYDVDDKANVLNSSFNLVRQSMKAILGSERNVNIVSICTNPNILQFILLGADILKNVSMTSTNKNLNSELVHKYWNQIGKNKPYDAKQWQLSIIKESFQYNLYNAKNIIKNAEDLSLDYRKLPGSNLLPLLKALIEDDENFFSKAKSVLKRKFPTNED